MRTENMNRINAQTRRIAAAAAVASMALVTSAAHAAIDVSAVVDEIEGAVTPIGLIGAAVLVVVVSIAAFKWVRRAIS
jgi:hypothetical protein